MTFYGQDKEIYLSIIFFLFLKHLVVLGGQVNANLTEKYRLSKPRML